MKMAANAEEVKLLKEFEYLSKLINEHKKSTMPKNSFSWNKAQRSKNVRIVQAKSSTPDNAVTKKNSRCVLPIANKHVYRRTNDDVVAAGANTMNSFKKVNSRNVWYGVNSSAKTTTCLETTSNTRSFGVTAPANPFRYCKAEGDVPKKIDSSTLFSRSRLVSVNEGDLTVKIANKSKNSVAKSCFKLPNQLALAAPKVQNHFDEARIVYGPNSKSTSRLVLKPSQYQWTAGAEIATSLNSAKKSPVVKKGPISVTPRTRRSPVSSCTMMSRSPFKLRNVTAKTFKMHNVERKENTKSIKTKYKIVKRQSPNVVSRKLATKYKVVNKKTVRSPFKFVRKVRKYSIKYVQVDKSKNFASPTFSTRYSKHKPHLISTRFDSRKYLKHHVVKRISRDFKKVSPLSSKLVMIGGIFYKSSRTRLSRTDEKSNNNIVKITKMNSRTPKVITVRGVKFFMDRTGKTLKRVNEPSLRKEVNKKSSLTAGVNMKMVRVDLGGKTYIQKEPGILIQSQVTQARTLASRVVNRSIHHFVAARRKSTQYCMFFNRFGKCRKKDEGKCPYIHDVEKVAVCTRFLQGNCTVENCVFSHKLCETKMPACSFFLRGRCNNDSCPYLHVNVNPDAKTCQDFLKGYCPLGKDCKMHHRFACPEFQQKGSCGKGDKCPLKHVKRKDNKRKLGNFKVSEESEVTKLPGIKPRCKSDNPESSEEDDPSSPKRKRLPSFIKLSDDYDLLESELNSSNTVSQPLRIKPQFLSKEF